MNSYFKKIIGGVFLLAALFSAQNIFAQSVPISNITIDIAQKKIRGYVNQSFSGKDIYLYLETSSGAGTEIDTIEWKQGNFETDIQNFTITPPTISWAGMTLTRLHIDPSEGADYFVELSQIFGGTGGGSGGGGQTSNVTVDFPGWASSSSLPLLPGSIKDTFYCKKATSEEIYPCIRASGDVVRTPASAPLYIILRETSSKQIGLLRTIPGGAASTALTVLSPEEANNGFRGLPPDTNFEIYIASDAEGKYPVNYGNSTDTLKSLGKIPASTENIVTVTKAEIKTTTAGKKYFEVSGVVNKTIRDRMINLIVRKAGETSGGASIAQVPYNKGSVFTNVPNAQTLESLASLEDGSYNLIFSQTIPPGVPQVIQTYELPVVGAGTGTGTGGTGTGNGGTGSGGGGAITPYISPDQQKILDEGIVPTDCGYTDPATGKHKLCGFPQLITLIDRAIQYIFILMLPITAIVFAYAGFLFLTSGGSADKRTKAKKAMTSVVIGIIIILAAFLVVRTILVAIGVDTSQEWVYLDI